MTIYEDKIRQEHGSVRAFLRSVGSKATSFQTLKNKTTDVFHADKDVFKLKKILEEHGYVPSTTQNTEVEK